MKDCAEEQKEVLRQCWDGYVCRELFEVLWVFDTHLFAARREARHEILTLPSLRNVTALLKCPPVLVPQLRHKAYLEADPAKLTTDYFVQLQRSNNEVVAKFGSCATCAASMPGTVAAVDGVFLSLGPGFGKGTEFVFWEVSRRKTVETPRDGTRAVPRVNPE